MGEYVIKKIRDFFISFEISRKLYALLFHPKYLIGVNFVAFNKDKEVLLAKHSWKEKYKWRVPGGLIEKKEGLREGLVREVKEELGLDINKGKLFFMAAIRNKDFPRIDVYFLYNRPIAGNLKFGSEIRKLRFFKISSLPTELFPGQAEVIRRSFDLISTKD